MHEPETTNEQLTLRWVAVQGEDGRVRMEARWYVVGAAHHRPHAA